MIEIFDCEQGSPEWFACRLGIPTASMFEAVMAEGKGADGKKSSSASKTRRTYMLKLIGERITGEMSESYSNEHMERGKVMEAEARDCYAFMTDEVPQPIGFIRNGEKGCSPDSLIGDDGTLEIKTRLPHLQIEVLLAGVLPSENRHQVQGQLWVSGRQFCDYVSYSRGMPLFNLRVYRDEAYIKQIEEKVAAFLAEMHELELRICKMGDAQTDQKMSAA